MQFASAIRELYPEIYRSENPTWQLPYCKKLLVWKSFLLAFLRPPSSKISIYKSGAKQCYLLVRELAHAWCVSLCTNSVDLAILAQQPLPNGNSLSYSATFWMVEIDPGVVVKLVVFSVILVIVPVGVLQASLHGFFDGER